MFAVVQIAGKQFRVSPRDTITVPLLHEKPGTKVQFDRVLLIGGEKDTAVGNPLVGGARVEATVLGDLRDEKLVVFKKKKRKGYRVKRGHRQTHTRVEITKIAK